MPTDADVIHLLGPVSPSIPLHVPRPGRSEPEAVLAAANQRARAGSLARLGAALPGIDVATLAQTADGAAATIGRWIGPGSITDVPADPRGALLAAVDLATAAPRTARLVDGDNVADTFLSDPTVVRDALDHGWTLLVDHADPATVHPGLADVVDDLARAFGAPVTTTVEAATTSSRGAGPTLRPGDHLQLQLVGTQHRFVQQPVALSPHPSIPETAPVQPGPQYQCDVGSAVHLPRGWHGLRLGREDISVAVELTILRPTVVDVLHTLADLAAARPLLRADVPFDAERHHGAYAGSVMADPNLWTAEFGTLVDWPGFDQAIASLRAAVPASPPRDPRRTAGDRRDTRNRVPGGVLIGPEQDGQVVVAAGGSVVSIPTPSVTDLARRLAPDDDRPRSPAGPLTDALVALGWLDGPAGRPATS